MNASIIIILIFQKGKETQKQLNLHKITELIGGESGGVASELPL